jgi:RimK family alpha-L-glutamate ligase
VARVAIIAVSPSVTNRNLVSSWRMSGIDAFLLHPSQCPYALREGDLALGRVDVRRSLDGVEPGLGELSALRRRGVHVLNPPKALLQSHDKWLTARLLTAARVPHPSTEHILSADSRTRLQPPVVVKPRFGSWGADVVRCNTKRELRRTLAGLSQRKWFRRHGALVQSLVPPVGHDLRVLVAGGRVVGGVSRVATRTEWRTNISLGGHRQPTEIPTQARALAIAAATAVSGDLVGVDLLPDGDDCTVIEVNGAVDFNHHYSLPDTDVFTEIASAIGILPPAQDHPIDLRPRALAPSIVAIP